MVSQDEKWHRGAGRPERRERATPLLSSTNANTDNELQSGDGKPWADCYLKRRITKSLALHKAELC